ncbi:hypothetical protein [Oceanibaculum pacificum]|uniref:Flagellar basal-body protein FlbY n=1 Tax=Oceanibaculum pacificum TaxID=580166 RepID=A0A154W3V4_9PROT|nr:hypothetical protein [Oceanibaculum pacificum]KZD08137.1 hypothetical protein AUP43_09005 [Oceanibaculum pacificum]
MNAAFAAMTLAQEAPALPVSLASFNNAIDRLFDVLTRETQCIEQRRIKEIGVLQDEKNLVSNDYVKLHRALHENPAPIRALPEEERRQLGQRMVALQDMLGRNMIALASAVEAGERVFQVIKNAVQSKRAETGGYTASGQFSYGVSTPKHETVSVAIDKQI